MSEDRCICCGEIVPEGRMVCPNCMAKLKDAPMTLKPYVQKGRLVEVTRCRECRWYSKEEGICFHPSSIQLRVREDFYCAYGKRRKADEV